MSRILMLLALVASSGLRAEDDADFFRNTVNPILKERCYSCHGPDKQKGKLRLDSLDAVLKGGKGGAAAVSGKPDDSLMIKAIRYQDADLKMPPKGKQLSDDQTKALVDWVKRGLPWPAETSSKKEDPKPADPVAPSPAPADPKEKK